MSDELTANEHQDLVEFLAGEAPSKSEEDKMISSIRGLPLPVIKWVLGLTRKEPLLLDRVMDQVSTKINISLAMMVINRLVRLNGIMGHMGALEDELFSAEGLAEMGTKEKMGLYRHFDKTMSGFLDFVRKFVGQNQEMFDRRHPADELADLLRGVDSGVLRKLVEVLRVKGASLTESDIEETMGESPDTLLAELVK